MLPDSSNTITKSIPLQIATIKITKGYNFMHICIPYSTKGSRDKTFAVFLERRIFFRKFQALRDF